MNLNIYCDQTNKQKFKVRINMDTTSMRSKMLRMLDVLIHHAWTLVLNTCADLVPALATNPSDVCQRPV